MTTAKEMMRPIPFSERDWDPNFTVSAPPEATFSELVEMLYRAGACRVIVTSPETGEPVGLITAGDLIAQWKSCDNQNKKRA